jgi:Asp-tRNA(Asn)/Glu-tRNA(Gln) amidotransferase A subunit family amidase
VTPEPAPSCDTTGDSRFQIPWTLCGFPALALPSGRASGLPLAVQLVAAPNAEGKLLAVARWCEQILDLHLTANGG